MNQEGFKRKLTAILSADAVGYSRLMGEDETSTIETLKSYRKVISVLIKQHSGVVIDSTGDNLLAEFVSVVEAVQCAVAVQKELKSRNDELTESRRMLFRIGINLGDVIREEDGIYGDGVNIAARLEGLAEPGGICISKTAFDHVEDKLPYTYEYLGDQRLKNISKSVAAYQVQLKPKIITKRDELIKENEDSIKSQMNSVIGDREWTSAKGWHRVGKKPSGFFRFALTGIVAGAAIISCMRIFYPNTDPSEYSNFVILCNFDDDINLVRSVIAAGAAP
jgi:adenylate cyclase